MSAALKILIIDDSDGDRMLCRHAILKSEKIKYTISEASGGEQGLECLHTEEPDCILLDYSMPRYNGVEILRRIRTDHPFIPVIMLTGQGSESVAVTAMKEGAQNYISKGSITPENIRRIILGSIDHCLLEKKIHDQRTSLEIFTRALAHDLKEPVRTIRSFLDIIAAEAELPEKSREHFTYISNAADRMNSLIETVYFYTRLEGGERMAWEVCDIAKVLSEAKENIASLIADRQAKVKSGALPEVMANRMQLIQVMQNLLCNAINHSENEPHIYIESEELAECWLIRVSDNGAGVLEEDREKIFQPFKRMSSPKVRGLGLGLAICRKILEVHGGKIWCEANSDGGASFIFTIPKASPASAPLNGGANSADKMPIEPDARPLANLLLVDDSDADIALARIMLIKNAHLKCNLLVAHDGKEAMNKIRAAHRENNPIDLMLLDINMPGIDGFELLEKMQNDQELKHTAAIMCTTSIYDRDMARARNLGAFGYLAKPAEINKLKLIIEKIPHLEIHAGDDGLSLRRALQ